MTVGGGFREPKLRRHPGLDPGSIRQLSACGGLVYWIPGQARYDVDYGGGGVVTSESLEVLHHA